MTDATDSHIADNRPFAGFLPDQEMAKERGITPRTQRAERQRGEGPPYVKIGKKIFYSVEEFRAWLKQIETRPVRTRKAA